MLHKLLQHEVTRNRVDNTKITVFLLEDTCTNGGYKINAVIEELLNFSTIQNKVD